jgi:hypothetical protein
MLHCLRNTSKAKMKNLALSVVMLVAVARTSGSEPPRIVKHVIVYKEPGRFAGWPANHGAWSWGDEIVIGFEVGHFRATDQGHAIDYSKPAQHVLARSLDGGETWVVERPESLRPPPGAKVAGVPTGAEGKEPADCPGGIDFTQPGFALTARMTSIHAGESRFYYSYDRGKTWQGPFRLPNFGQPGIAARTDYIVNGKHDCTLFLTAAKSNEREGRVICVRTKDGGKTWDFVSFIGPEPEDYAIMPSTVRLGSMHLLTAIRRRHWIDSWRSFDGGESWQFVNQPVVVTGGNPPCLTKLRDGRLVISYGYREKPYGVRARISTDEGQTWSPEIRLREDGGRWDLGYARTVQRTDGKLVTAYYFNDSGNSERYIGATIWEAGAK